MTTQLNNDPPINIPKATPIATTSTIPEIETRETHCLIRVTENGSFCLKLRIKDEQRIFLLYIFLVSVPLVMFYQSLWQRDKNEFRK